MGSRKTKTLKTNACMWLILYASFQKRFLKTVRCLYLHIMQASKIYFFRKFYKVQNFRGFYTLRPNTSCYSWLHIGCGSGAYFYKRALSSPHYIYSELAGEAKLTSIYLPHGLNKDTSAAELNFYESCLFS